MTPNAALYVRVDMTETDDEFTAAVAEIESPVARLLAEKDAEISVLRAVAEAADYYLAWQGTISEAVAYQRLCDALDAYNAKVIGAAPDVFLLTPSLD